MADYAQSRSAVEGLILLVSAIITLIPGLVIHSFIIGVNVNDWWKRRSITPVDHIVTFLEISRMGIQWTNFFYVIDFVLLRSPSPSLILDINNKVYIILSYTNIWLTTLFLIVFCLKVSNIRSRLFQYLRRMILPRTGHFIVASGLLSAFIELITYLPYNSKVTSDGLHNTTMDNQLRDCVHISAIINFTIMSIFQILFYFISSILLFFSLYHHTVKMKMSSNLSINLETYYSAMKFVLFTFIYNTIYLLGHFVCAFSYYFRCKTPTWPYVILDFFPVIHSIFLIYTTLRLRRQMSEFLQNVIDFIFQTKRPEMRENIEVIAH